jgi:hypothetical protein
VVAHVELKPSTTLRLTDSARITFSLPAASAMSAPYYLSYRGPNADAWINPGAEALALKDRSTATMSFLMNDLPTVLNAGETYNVVLYYVSRSAA